MRRAFEDTKALYYDPTFHGIDLSAMYQKYDGALDKAPTLDEAMRLIASFLAELHDSHLYFYPPKRETLYMADYRFKIIGDRCYITQVKPGTQAATQLRIGDRLLQLNSFDLQRNNIADVEYYFRMLAPPKFDAVTVRGIDGRKRTVRVDAERLPRALSNPREILHIQNAEYLDRNRFVDTGKIVIWKMPVFDFEEKDIDAVFSRARKRSGLILDLRGNPGGSEDSLRILVGRLFDHEVKIADRVGRKKTEALVSKKQIPPYLGPLYVLVDSDSGSGAELLARVVQLEHRGVVLGDRTAGAVMEAIDESEHVGYSDDSDVGFGTGVQYSFSITRADLMMSDGQRLEGKGVQPDYLILPTPQDLEQSRDPVLARATELAGDPMTPESAGRLFPFEWEKLF